MGTLKTTANDGDAQVFIDSIEDEAQRSDAQQLLSIMREETGAEPAMYGPTIVGFGKSTITYADGRTQDWFAAGFSPRKGKFSLYIVSDAEKHREILGRLGKHKTGKACIWVKKLADIDTDVLREMVRNAVA